MLNVQKNNPSSGIAKIERRICFFGKDTSIISFLANANDKTRLISDINKELREGLNIKETIPISIKIDQEYENTFKEHGQIRIIISNDILKIRIHEPISHLVNALPKSKLNAQFANANERFDLLVSYNNHIDIKTLIADVLFDIHMFYWHLFNEKYIDVIDRREFSKMKVEFVKNENLIDQSLQINYISLATLCRDNNILNFNAYKKLWNKFEAFVDRRSLSYDKKSYATLDALADDILMKHLKGKQISKRVLLNNLKDIDNSENSFLLIRSEKKPKNKKLEKSVLTLIGGVKWKTGRIKIVKFKDRQKYLRYSPYISIFVIER